MHRNWDKVTIIKIAPIVRHNDVIELCSTFISPRKFYMHNFVGGDDWMFKVKSRELIIKDSEIATFFVLKFGNKL